MGDSEGTELASYDELIEVIENLRFLVREKRRRHRLTLRAAAESISSTMNASTIHRFESGKDVSTDSLISMIRWVATDA